MKEVTVLFKDEFYVFRANNEEDDAIVLFYDWCLEKFGTFGFGIYYQFVDLFQF